MNKNQILLVVVVQSYQSPSAVALADVSID